MLAYKLLTLSVKHQNKKVAVVLSGCGVFDGTEIHEAVLTLLSIEENGASWHCFAPKTSQTHVVDHATGEVIKDQTREVFSESARISRGTEKLSDLTEYDPSKFDCLVFPGGFGAAKNLSDFAFRGSEGTVLDSVKNAVKCTHSANMPIGFICITPASIGALTLGVKGINMTIGNDLQTSQAIEACGATHQECQVDDVIIDQKNKIVSTRAYMLGPGVLDIRKGIEKLILKILLMA